MQVRGDRWTDAVLAGALALIDPAGLCGVRLVARHGPVRDAWLAAVQSLVSPSAPWRRVGASLDPARLVGGLDFASSLQTGRAVMETGILPSASGGVLTLAMAERVGAGTAALIAAALDEGSIRVEREGFSVRLPARFVLLALDEGIDDEAVPAILAERLAFAVDLEGLPIAAAGAVSIDIERIARARRVLPEIVLSPAMMRDLVLAASEVGRPSARTALFLCRAARAAAALRGAGEVAAADAVLAARLVLDIALVGTAPTEAAADAGDPPEGNDTQDVPETEDSHEGGSARESIVEAAAATLPEGALALAGARQERAKAARQAGRGGIEGESGARGRTVGSGAARPRPQARIDLVATLRAAVPWQRLRQRGKPEGDGRPIRIARDDLRYARRREKRGTTALFVVDASGSAAAARLAETKGAIELLLAECYVRRDEVALVAFRGTTSEILLQPTRSLVRAKRSLAGLPGGGPTPLAHGIGAAAELAYGLARRGRDTITVFLTDGRGNVALDGSHDRAAAARDASAQARRFHLLQLRSVVIDTSTRPQPTVRGLAESLGAEYLALPRGGAERISSELSLRLQG